MARNPSGVYSLPAGSIVTDGVDDILASQHNTPLQDIAQDLNTARPVVAGGTGADNAPGARTNLGLGTAAVANIQTTSTDATAGRLLVVGAAGAALGADVYRRANILGTVSQSGGVPTGAIIEFGSNASGEYVRFADGTQICWHRIDLGSITAAGAGTLANPYRTASQNWTYPAEFASGTLPEVLLTAEYVGALTDVRRVVSPSKATRNRLTQFTIQAWRWSTVSDADEFIMAMTAIGRWF